MGNKVVKKAPLEGYNEKTTTDDVLKGKDLTGRNVLVTGCTSGIGKEFARSLYSKGANIFMLCRNAEKMAKIEKLWKERHPDVKGKVIHFKIDISHTTSVKLCAEQVAKYLTKEGEKLDYILLNGLQVEADFLHLNENGQEFLFAGCIYSSHIIICTLLPHMNERGKILHTSSSALKDFEKDHPEGLNFNDLDMKGYLGYKEENKDKKVKTGMMKIVTTMGNAKLAEASLFYTMDQRIQKDDNMKNVSFYSCQPGLTSTEGFYNYNFLMRMMINVMFIITREKWQPVDVGVSTLVVAAVDDRAFEYRGKIMKHHGLGDPHIMTYDPEMGNKLLEVVEKETGMKFPF